MDASTKPILVNREKAVEVARIFMRHPHIHAVELFGSVARDGQGNDLDLILITDEVRGSDFVTEVRDHLDCIFPEYFEEKEDGEEDDVIDITTSLSIQKTSQEQEQETVFSYNCPIVRINVARRVLRNGFQELVDEARHLFLLPAVPCCLIPRDFPLVLDVFVFPSNWRDWLPVLQENLPNKDPRFMENIARDAVRIA